MAVRFDRPEESRQSEHPTKQSPLVETEILQRSTAPPAARDLPGRNTDPAHSFAPAAQTPGPPP